MAGVSGGESVGEAKRLHVVQPQRDLEANWEVDLAKKLEDYLLKICSGEISGSVEDDSHSPKDFGFRRNFVWKQLWKVLAEQFGIEEYGFEEGKNVRLTEMMKGKESVWEEMVKENQLLETSLAEVGNWWFVDIIIESK